MSEFWQHDFLTTIDAYYDGRLAEGRDTCERLLSLPSLPPDMTQQTQRNQVFYAPRLGELATLHTWPVKIPVAPGWTCFNPSVAHGPDGISLILRSANFATSPQLTYTVHDDAGIVRTTNYLVSLDADLAVQDVSLLDDQAFRPEPPAFPVTGFEDCRLFWQDGSWWTSATVRDRTPAGICQMALLRLENCQPVELRLLSDGETRHEKNWMPVAGGSDALRFVYSVSPTVLLRVDPTSGEVTRAIEHPAPHIARHLRGGSQVIAVDDGHLCLGHESVTFDDGSRVYLHRWVWFDGQWRLARLSCPFIFHERGVEFAAGLARQGDDLVISYGVWDREAWLAKVPLTEVLPMLAAPLDPVLVEQEMRDRHTQTIVPAGDAFGVIRAASAQDSGVTPAHPGVRDGFTPAPVRLVSTTITGNSAEIIGDALQSVVDWVDWCLLIDTGITDDTIRLARDIAGEKLVVRDFPWCDDFSAARNFALAAAAELGADWAVTLDADERLQVDPVDIRQALAQTDADALFVLHKNGTYGKERFFRLPARGQYVGPTHEAFVRNGDVETLHVASFDELGKTRAQYQRKAERDIAILARHVEMHPDDPRWFYYLGDSLAGLERHDEAIAAFRVCASLGGWDEEAAWAMYRAAESLLKLGRPADAIEACAVGMARHAGLAELPWLAGFAAWQAGRPAQAAHWARVSIALGHYQGAGPSQPRTGFRHPPGLWEAPFDVLRFALRSLGDIEGAEAAERDFAAALAARESLMA
jgi:tetratricopeptide (TPR) repeat protein